MLEYLWRLQPNPFKCALSPFLQLSSVTVTFSCSLNCAVCMGYLPRLPSFNAQVFFFLYIFLIIERILSTLIENKIKFSSYIRKVNISRYVRRPLLLVIYDFATAPLWISLYFRKIWFSFFYQCREPFSLVVSLSRLPFLSKLSSRLLYPSCAYSWIESFLTVLSEEGRIVSLAAACPIKGACLPPLEVLCVAYSTFPFSELWFQVTIPHTNSCLSWICLIC